MDQFGTAVFWLALGKIILLNIVLSGDNAIVIAMAARSLPADRQRQAIVYGSAGAVFFRIVLTVSALTLLALPYLKMIGAFLLFYIGTMLLAEEESEGQVPHHGTLAAAIRTILIADLVMSLDNVLGVAAAAKGNVALLAAGLVISIPLIAFGSSLILMLMQRVPAIIVLGAALLGYLSGEMLFADIAVQPWLLAHLPSHDWIVPGTAIEMSLPGMVGAAAVVLCGRWLAARLRNP